MTNNVHGTSRGRTIDDREVDRLVAEACLQCCTALLQPQNAHADAAADEGREVVTETDAHRGHISKGWIQRAIQGLDGLLFPAPLEHRLAPVLLQRHGREQVDQLPQPLAIVLGLLGTAPGRRGSVR